MSCKHSEKDSVSLAPCNCKYLNEQFSEKDLAIIQEKILESKDEWWDRNEMLTLLKKRSESDSQQIKHMAEVINGHIANLEARFLEVHVNNESTDKQREEAFENLIAACAKAERKKIKLITGVIDQTRERLGKMIDSGDYDHPSFDKNKYLDFYENLRLLSAPDVLGCDQIPFIGSAEEILKEAQMY